MARQMKNKRDFLKYLLVFVLSFLISTEGFSAGMGMGGGPCGGIFPPCPVPLNSGEIFLLIAGVVFGAYKIYCSIKKNPV
jgi:hypothetical protein